MLCMLSEDLMGFLVSGKWRGGREGGRKGGREGGREGGGGGGGGRRGSYTKWRAFVQGQFA